MPKVSVVIACYNIENYISQSLYSIINQTFDDIEIIVVNDGSMDNTLNIIQDIAKQDSRVIIINQQNQGVSVARNNALDTVKGEYVCFVDGDDWLEPDAIEQLLNYSEYDLVCCSFFKDYDTKLVIRDLQYSNEVKSIELQRRLTGLVGAELKDPGHLDTFAPVWAKLFKTKIIKQHNINFYDIKKIGSWEDGYFVWNYLNHAKEVYVINKPYYHYRKDNISSITSNYKDNMLQKSTHQLQLIQEAIAVNNKEPIFTQAYQNRVCISIMGLGLNVLFSKKNLIEKRNEMKTILQTPFIKSALKQLDLQHFPIHWKAFFYAAQKQHIFPLLLMLGVIKKAIKK